MMEAIGTLRVSKFSIFIVLFIALFLFGVVAEAIFFADEIFKRSEIVGYSYLSLL